MSLMVMILLVTAMNEKHKQLVFTVSWTNCAASIVLGFTIVLSIKSLFPHQYINRGSLLNAPVVTNIL
jgi:hypothetical protein